MTKTILTAVAAILAVSSFAIDLDAYNKEMYSLTSARNYSQVRKLYENIEKLSDGELKPEKLFWIVLNQINARRELGETQENLLAWVQTETSRLGYSEDMTRATTFYAKYSHLGWAGAKEEADKLTEDQRRGSHTAIWMSHIYSVRGTTVDELKRAIEYALIGCQSHQAYFAANRLKNTAIALDTANRVMDRKLITVAKPQQALNFVTMCTRDISEVDAPAVKAFLQRANRTWSLFLLQDAEAWKPVITLIRTALEAY